ncbi:hypothetical protein E2562_030412 [Oryza meyeriana var. granulata]|uniref:Uncharacterized protein n=1 Tax=Oryza meyeriana var. granulata TaxID=110450 RepID=A0A6G1FEA9_9ORYZ|nr:hypothetical protein E2562_030412 [Oryza meyeriana var. granulata]
MATAGRQRLACKGCLLRDSEILSTIACRNLGFQASWSRKLCSNPNNGKEDEQGLSEF